MGMVAVEDGWGQTGEVPERGPHLASSMNAAICVSVASESG